MGKFDPSEKALVRMNEVVAKFQAGDLSDIADIAFIDLPEGAPAAKWTVTNRFLAWAQTGSLDCRHSRAWKKIGRWPKKGSHACYIWEPFQIWERDQAGNWIMEVGSNGKEQHKVKFTAFRLSPRFAYHDTEGAEVEHYEAVTKDPPPLMEVAEALGVSVSYDAGMAYAGTTTIDGDDIVLYSQSKRVFSHELAHACHTRLGYEKTSDEQTAQRETVAEFTACVLAAIYGQEDISGDSWRYIKSYNPDPLEAVKQAMRQIQQVVGLVEGIMKGETIDA